jgi:hypothetical protein
MVVFKIPVEHNGGNVAPAHGNNAGIETQEYIHKDTVLHTYTFCQFIHTMHM